MSNNFSNMSSINNISGFTTQNINDSFFVYSPSNDLNQNNQTINYYNGSINTTSNYNQQQDSNSIFNEKDYLNESKTPDTPVMNLNISTNKDINSDNNSNFINKLENQQTKTYSIENKITQINTEAIINDNITPKIENIVSVANLNCELNLKEVAIQIRNAEYNPKRFSAVIIRQKEPKTTALIFSNGKIVCLGAKSVEDSKKGCRKFAKVIKNLNYSVQFTNFKIVNIVGSADVKFPINLSNLFNKLYFKFKKNKNLSEEKIEKFLMYEPEVFPGLFLHIEKVVLLIFHSGKLSIVGGKTIDQIYKAFNDIYPVLVRIQKKENNKNKINNNSQ